MAKLTEAQERQRASWQYRAVEATQGNRSMMGCLVQAVIGHGASNPPTMGLTGFITAEGFLFTNFIDRHGRLHAASDEAVFPPLCIGHIDGVIAEFRALADQLRLNDPDREAMFDALRKWVAVDERAMTPVVPL